MQLIISLFLLSVAVYAVAYILPGIKLKNYGTAIIVAIVYSLVNFFLGWLLSFLALPFIILTLGLFNFVVNAIMLWITDKMMDDFEIDGPVTTLLAAFLITVANWVLGKIFLAG